MKKNIAKKTIILYILKIFEEASVSMPNQPLILNNIAKALNTMGIVCDRKTVGRNVKYLVDFGIPIVKSKKGYYMDNSDGEYQYMLKR